MTKIFVMLIWVSSLSGGPATIQGFTSSDACEQAMPQVKTTFKKLTWAGVDLACVELEK